MLPLQRIAYNIIEQKAECIYKTRGSKFLTFAFPVENEWYIKQKLSELKNIYHDATHICYAYRIGFDGNKFRTHDAGEPAHSAGIPILNQIDRQKITNILVVVVRYFGGTKLGLGGLKEAYKIAASTVLENLKIISKTLQDTYRIQFNYDYLNTVLSILGKNQNSIHQIAQNYTEFCIITIRIDKHLCDAVLDKLRIIPKLEIELIKTE